MGPSASRAHAWWGAGTATVVVLGGSLLVLAQRGSLPERVAVHWAGPRVTETLPLTTHVILTGLTVVVVGGLFTLLSTALGVAPRAALTGLGVGCTVFLGATGYGIALAQRGLLNPLDAENPAATVVGSTLLALAVGMIAARAGTAGPAEPAPQRPMLPASAVRLRDDAQGQLFWRALSSAGPTTVAVVSVLVLVPLALLAFFVRDWWMLALGVMLGTFVASLCVSVVTIDGEELALKGFGFVPWLRVPLTHVAYADVVDARPHSLTGIGLRHTDGGTVTFLTRPGPALRLVGIGGPDVLVGIPDPHTAAATVNSLIEHEAIASRAAA